VARLSGILFMLFPLAWFYSVIMMKENIMVLLIIESVYQTLKLQKTYKTLTLLKLLTFIILLFFFRSAVSILMVIVAAFSMFMQWKKKRMVVNILVGCILLAVYGYFLQSTGRADEYYEQYLETDEFEAQRIETGSKVNPFIAAANAPAYFGISFFAPFPSMVKVPIGGGLSHNEYYYHVAGCMMWVVLAFFSVYGLYYTIRYYRLQLVPVWAFIIGYQFILLKAIFFTSVRFSYLAKPLLLIMAAIGVYRIKNKKWFILYLILAFFMIIGWNYVRIKGRNG